MRNPWSDQPWQRVAVYGLGVSGRAAAHWLLDHEVEVLAVDRRPPQELDTSDFLGERSFGLIAGGDPGRLPDGIEALVLSPGVPATMPLVTDARERGLPVVAEIELAYAQLADPELGHTFLAITGSNGKSTTTALAGAMLSGARVAADCGKNGRAIEVCGNIGEPLAGAIDGPPGRTFVIELSSFQLETVDTFRADAAALLNVSADHLDRYPDLAAYTAAKRRIFRHQRANDTAILNADDPLSAATEVGGRRRLFSRSGTVDDGCWLDGDRVIERQPSSDDVELFAVGDLPLTGVHNLENAMAAALLARSAGVSAETIRQAIRGFTALPHRLELVGRTEAGVSWYDDSKGTNPAATAKSVEGFADGSVHLILGGRNKGADFAELAGPVGRKAKQLYLIGEAADEIATALAETAPIEACGTLDRAVAAAAERAEPGEVVVLSPACASFDQFSSFKERGERFRRLVDQRIHRPERRDHGQEVGV